MVKFLLFDSFYDVVTELGLHRLRDLPLLQFESTRLELLDHLSAPKLAEVAAFFAAGAKANLLRDGTKRFTLLEAFLDGFGFGLGFDEYVGTSDFVWHTRRISGNGL